MTADAALSLSALPALADNYIWVLHHRARGVALVVDPSTAPPVRDWLAAHSARLAAILITHHHFDHVGGVAELAAATGAKVYGPTREQQPLPKLDVGCGGGEEIRIDDLDATFRTLHVPGHTLGAIAYHGSGVVFSGDTLFSAGCGRLFEGTPAMMHDSLSRLAALPGDTQLCCGHEYTVANLAFAHAVEPDNAAIAAHAERAQQQRARNEPTLPSKMADELEINPFLRCAAPTVRRAVTARLGRPPRDDIETFACVRQWKDTFKK